MRSLRMSPVPALASEGMVMRPIRCGVSTGDSQRLVTPTRRATLPPGRPLTDHWGEFEALAPGSVLAGSSTPGALVAGRSGIGAAAAGGRGGTASIGGPGGTTNAGGTRGTAQSGGRSTGSALSTRLGIAAGASLGIMGVRSKSTDPSLRVYKGAERYSEWLFLATEASTTAGATALHECQSCGHLTPTPAGQAKVERCVERGIAREQAAVVVPRVLDEPGRARLESAARLEAPPDSPW